MWLSVRVQVLRKEIEGLELRRETLVVQVAERRRAVEERMAFAEMEPCLISSRTWLRHGPMPMPPGPSRFMGQRVREGGR